MVEKNDGIWSWNEINNFFDTVDIVLDKRICDGRHKDLVGLIYKWVIEKPYNIQSEKIKLLLCQCFHSYDIRIIQILDFIDYKIEPSEEFNDYLLVLSEKDDFSEISYKRLCVYSLDHLQKKAMVNCLNKIKTKNQDYYKSIGNDYFADIRRKTLYQMYRLHIDLHIKFILQ